METTREVINGHQARINVTPLVDVVLVLLIIFMVVAPIDRRAYDIDVPVQAAPAERADETFEQVVLDIDAELCPAGGLPEVGLPPGCRVRLADTELDAAGLAAASERIYSGRRQPDRLLFLAAEDDLDYELVLRIVDSARTHVPDLRIGLVADARVDSPVVTQETASAYAVVGDRP